MRAVIYGIASRVGLTGGVGRVGPRLDSFAAAEMRYRQEGMIADALRRRRLVRVVGGAGQDTPQRGPGDTGLDRLALFEAVSYVLAKLGASGRAEAVAILARHGLLNRPG